MWKPFLCYAHSTSIIIPTITSESGQETRDDADNSDDDDDDCVSITWEVAGRTAVALCLLLLDIRSFRWPQQREGEG